MKKFLFMIVAALMSFAGVSAQVDFKQIVLGENGQATIVLERGSGVNYFMFTAPMSGTLSFNVGWSSTMVYLTDRNGNEDTKTLLTLASDYDGGTGHTYSTTVESGQVYYFSTSLVTDEVTMTVGYGMEDNSIKINTNYEDGDEFNMTGSNLEFTVDRPVNIEKTVVAYPGGEEEVPTDYIQAISITNYYYTIMLRNLVEYLMDGGKLAVGDEFTIRLEGITDAANPDEIYGEDGTYSITLKLAEMPATLVSIDPADGSTLLTYYPEGGEDGFIVFTFSEPLNENKDNVNVTMTWGDQEAGSYESYSPDFTIEGNTVTVDIRGIFIPLEVDGGRGGMGATKVTLALRGLTTADGRTVASNYPDTGTSAVLAIYGVEKQDINFIYDFDPQSGNQSLEGYDEILIWLSDPVIYDGVTVKWYNVRGEQQSRTYTAEQVPFAWSDDYAGYVATVPINNISYNTQPVTLTVDNARLMNGEAVEIYGEFNTGSTGIDGVTAADPDRVVKVYAVDGTFVKEGKAGEVLGGLKKGVYITEGKKVLVK